MAGLFAAASSAHVLGIEPMDALARPAAMEMERQLAAGSSLRAIEISGDPSSSDCSQKPYAAVAQIETTAIEGSAGWSFDAGLVLLDCAGWNVDEWHEQLSLDHPPTSADAEKLGINLLLRLRTWMYAKPVLADTLFSKGLAYRPHAAPTYFYTLFKTSDGEMRAFVRPGGPAYEAGMRTNDIVEKIDGRWWWEYGTYQAEQRAYDGKPHAFELKRGKTTLVVRLGEPFRT